MKRAYLATSYSWKTTPFMRRNLPWVAKIVQRIRYRRVNKAMAKLMMSTGWNVFSPITHSHPIPKYIPDRLDTHTFWLNLDFDWISTCDELWVYQQPGWDYSYGVKKELELAKSLDMPVRYVDFKTYQFKGEPPERFRLPIE